MNANYDEIIMNWIEKNGDITVGFHKGRGGRFYNPGHISLARWQTVPEMIAANSDKLFEYTEDEEGNPCAPYLTDCNGSVMVPVDEMDADTLTLDWDGEYDTDYVVWLSDVYERCEYARAIADSQGFYSLELSELKDLLNKDEEEDE